MSNKLVKISELNGFTANQIEIPDYYFNRYVTDIPAFDNLFGGLGFLPGSVATCSAVKGGGKTTFLLTLLQAYADNGYNVGYSSAEEDIYQIAFNCKRIGVTSVPLYNFENMSDVIEMAGDTKLDVLVTDSLQKFSKGQAEQAKSTGELIKFSKANLCSSVIVMHSTKTGAVKGNSSIEHDVDVNLKISIGDPDLYGDASARLFSSSKNRFGQTVDEGQIVLRLSGKGFDYKNPVADGSIRYTPPAEMSATDRKQLQKKTDLEKIITVAKKHAITIADVYKAGIEDVPKIQKYLKELELAGIVSKSGRGKDCYWNLTPNFAN